MTTRLLAQLTNPALPASLGSNKSSNIVGLLVSNIVGALFIFAFFLTLVYLLTGGIQWLTSGGEKGALESARNKITNALIGLVIVASSYAIFTLVGEFFGITSGGVIKFPTF